MFSWAQVEGVPPNQVIRTLDPRLSMHNLPTYPLLPASTDPRRLEEIRRTIVVVNVDPSVSIITVLSYVQLHRHYSCHLHSFSAIGKESNSFLFLCWRSQVYAVLQQEGRRHEVCHDRVC